MEQHGGQRAWSRAVVETEAGEEARPCETLWARFPWGFDSQQKEQQLKDLSRVVTGFDLERADSGRRCGG